MEKIKFGLFSIVVLGTLGLVWYWSVSTIESGSEHAMRARVDQLEQENQLLTKQVKDLSVKLTTLKPEETEVKTTEDPAKVVVKEAEKPAATTTTTSTTTDKDQSLINELQKLVDDKINMKQGSAGVRVGTVQKFLNRYNNTSNKIDNDYGAGTVKLVTAFQKAEGLSADGEAGATTFSKMIAWLKSN